MISSQLDVVRAADRLNEHIEGRADRKDRAGKSPALLDLEKAIADGQLAVRRPILELIITQTED